MPTTLDMPATPCQLLPETEPTTIGTMTYEGFWASSVTLEEVVEVDRIAANPINHVDRTGMDIWIGGAAKGDGGFGRHQNICIGDPNGNYRAWSFGADGPWGIVKSFWPFNTTAGCVYENPNRGGKIIELIHTTPAQDAEAISILENMESNPTYDRYRLLYSNCRTFSQAVFQVLKERYAPPPPPPPPPPYIDLHLPRIPGYSGYFG
jgi:hypothetical protein